MSIPGLAALGNPVRLRVVIKYLGILCLSLSAMTAVPGLAAAVLGGSGFALRCFLMTALLLGFGIPAARLAAPTDMRRNEALTTTALTFLIGALAMSWPFMAAGLAFEDALFEAVSGITTTGLTVVAGLEHQSHALLFARAWMQWYGGLAIVVLALALMIGPGQVARRLEAGETPPEDLISPTHLRSRRMLAVYGLLTVVGVAALWLAGLAPFDALCHGLAAISTGGFSTRDTSLSSGPMSSAWVQAVIGLLSLAGAISLALQHRAWRRGLGQLLRDSGFRAVVAAIVLVTLLLWLSLVLAATREGVGGSAESLRHAAFLAVSAQTTTGFADTEVATLDPASQLVLIAAMVVGGDAGSTSGGIKIIRMLIILRVVQLLVAETCLPRQAAVEPRVAGRPLESGEVAGVLAFVALYLVAIAVSWFIFLLHGYAPLASLFEVVSAMGTVGLSSGLTDASLPAALKFVLGIDMLMGRLEIIALLVLVYHRTWASRAEAP